MSETPQSTNSNPFLGLLNQQKSEENDVQKTPSSSFSPEQESSPIIPQEITPISNETPMQSDSHTNILDTKTNAIIERIFRFTINKNTSSKKPLVYMEEIAQFSNNGLFKFDLLEQALFERLLLLTPEEYLISKDYKIDSDDYVIETKIINYLYRAFETCEQLNTKMDKIISELCLQIRSLIMRNIYTSITQPELYAGQSLPLQWLDVLKNYTYDENIKRNFLISVTKEFLLQDNDEITTMGYLKSIFYPMFNEIQKKLHDLNMININLDNYWILNIINLFISDKKTPQLGNLLIDYTTPNPDTEGRAFSETLFGQLLSLSILPKYQNGPYEFYNSPNDSQSNSLNESLWNSLRKHLDDMHLIFKKLLTLNDEVKNKTLSWIGNCLNSNIPRGQMWNTQNLIPLGNLRSASDSFMISLCGVLLRLCSPLFKPTCKVYLVDPTYCAVNETERLKKNVHLKNVTKETCLIPTEDNEERLTSNTYNFITECFFMTHKAIDLSYRVCIEMYMRLAREVLKLQQALADARAQGGNDIADNMLQTLEKLLQQFLCLKYTLIEPYNDQLLVKMCEATSIWLTEITAKTENDINKMTPETGYAPKLENKNIKLPLGDYVPPYLKCVPEYIIQNILSYLTFLTYAESQYLSMDIDAQNSIFRMILIFIGSIERVRNPHLRAELAKGLESFLPKDNQNSQNQSTTLQFDTKLFDLHPDRLQIVPNLLNVFVSIEMTGQSVQFEQKFQYRRPMYRIMEYLWERNEQKECFKQLALEAELKIEEINPPLFLRFINLLINDAIHLLDDSLTNLQQIRTLQAAQDNGEWERLSETERQRNISGLQQLGNITRFDNILGKDTINILKILTSEIKGIFCHETMVDRVAAMLNYFLLNLVGPKMKEFNVKDKKEFDFDPAHTVKEICRIYINLKDCDTFCLAVSQDGRSYNDKLFVYADQVLSRIGGGQLIGDMNEFAMKVQKIEKQHKEDQEALTDIPDEYLDPIMSTLMMDPVILPSSRVTVDRSTIARHLLSDQSDPFNRSPLTMDQIKPNVELKQEITQWIQQKRKEYKEQQENQMEVEDKEQQQQQQEKDKENDQNQE